MGVNPKSSATKDIVSSLRQILYMKPVFKKITFRFIIVIFLKGLLFLTGTAAHLVFTALIAPVIVAQSVTQ